MWWLLTILFFLISVGTSVFVYYALKRINEYEKIIYNIENIINNSSQKLKIIDDKGSFESDDEVGFFFTEIKNIQNILDSLFENINEDEVDNEEQVKENS